MMSSIKYPAEADTVAEAADGFMEAMNDVTELDRKIAELTKLRDRRQRRADGFMRRMEELK